ncbi:MAG: glycosyltransferase [Bacteroidales bacterium]|nr:glycosyltransferase [Bacteroidales bacterium]
MSIKVINIVNHPPAYEGHRGRPRPEINWDTPNGSWVGIWGYEWHDIIGKRTLRAADDIIYEVWQPDLRADKIYEHTFEGGLIHKLFPAIQKKFVHGLKLRKDIYSKTLMEHLEKEINKNQALAVHINAGFRYINIPILNKYSKKVPIVGQFYTNSSSIFDIPKTKNPFKLLNAYKKRWELYNYYKKLKYIIPSVKKGMEIFEDKFGAKVFHRDFANFGSQFDEWERTLTKEEAKKQLNIPPDKFIMFSSSRLIPIKQIDKMIEVLAQLENRNFICYISGRGSEDYEHYLKKVVEKHKLEENIYFIGYVDYDVLQKYFQAAYLLVSTSAQDAGPASPFQAAAMETPAFLTATGIAEEFFMKEKAGIIVPTHNYELWRKELNTILNGKKINVPERKKIIEFGSWEKVAHYYYHIYKTITKS